jgi:lysophospholipase L1-like esterase
MNVGNSYEGDYEIKDGNGNVLMRLKDGHIKTKKFDSSLGNFLLDKFIGKKIAIIGDSISTYSGWLPSDISGYDGSTYATYYPHGDVDNVTKTWWYKALSYLGLEPSTDLNNCSWSGSRVTGDSESTTSASAGCSTKRITDLSLRITTPDIVLVFIGCNDWGNEVAVGNWAVTDTVPSEGTISTFRPAFAVMLNKIHVTYPNARVFVCTILDDYKRDEIAGYPPENGNGVVTYQWNENIKEIAEAFGCDVIDMHNCGLTYSNMQSFCVDEGLHPNAAGMEMMARKVASELIAKY